jgi:uncharacterized protein
MGMKTLTGKFEPINECFPAAIRYAVSREYIDSAVVSITNFDHLLENFAALEKPFTDKDLNQLQLTLNHLNQKFCRSCYQCVELCTHKLPIPDIMRGLMYLEGYRNESLAANYNSKLKTSKLLSKCSECAQCSARCSYDLIIPQRLQKLQAWINSPTRTV